MVNIHIDELTNSILDRLSGKTHETIIEKLDFQQVQGLSGWNFDWSLESRKQEVWKLSTVEAPKIIQGLISLEIQKGFVFVSLVENAPHNIGKNGQFAGVAGNLFAFACKLSFEKGFDGFVSFVAKPALIEHYQKLLSAEVLFGKNMVIREEAALKLVHQYFK